MEVTGRIANDVLASVISPESATKPAKWRQPNEDSRHFWGNTEKISQSYLHRIFSKLGRLSNEIAHEITDVCYHLEAITHELRAYSTPAKIPGIP